MTAVDKQERLRCATERVCVITVSFHSDLVLAEMLASLPEGLQVVLVDNTVECSEGIRGLREKYGQRLIYVPMEDNKGFGTACNAGARHTDREFLFFLNPDTRLSAGCLGSLIGAMDENPDASASNPCILSRGGRVEFKYRSALLPRRKWISRSRPSVTCEMPALTGAALLVRKSAFEAVGGFDESIFLYHEDDDLSIRLKEQAGTLLYVPNAEVRHNAGHSSGRSSKVAFEKAYHKGVSRVYAMKKHRVPAALFKSLVVAIQGLLNPLNLFSRRKRIQAVGFVFGCLSGDTSARTSEATGAEH